MVIPREKCIVLIILSSAFIFSCREVPVPKPRGHFRIDLPAMEYASFNEDGNKKAIPFSFEYPLYGHLSFQPENGNDPGWFDLEFPDYRAKIYLTYKEVKNDLGNLLEQTYRLNVKNHITKADAINEQFLNNGENRVFGTLYDLKGNTATAVEFFVTDSVKHYLRGSLYFSAVPDADSLAPVIEFFREDIIHMINTLKWK